MTTTIQVTFDCADPRRMADFWAGATGYVLQPPPPGFDSWDAFADAAGMTPEQRTAISAVVDPGGVGPRLLFNRVPEAKAGKNRVHLDLHVIPPDTAPEDRARLLEIRVAELVALGAREAARVEEFGQRWVVMADPEGNEFCVA